jgi:hypothetical protein
MGTAPLAPGNFWKYSTSSWGYTYSSSYLVLNSKVTIQGQEYSVIKCYDGFIYNSYMGIRDSFYVRREETNDDSVYKYFKFNCQPGDVWTEQIYNDTYTYTVTDTFTINAWGSLQRAIVIHITTGGLIEMYQLWTDSLGLLSENRVGDYKIHLVGCVINGQVYGDTSMFPTSVDDIDPEIKDFVLYQNYPNPFNTSSTIRYKLPYNTDVKITIYNILSEKISTIVDEYQYAGLHRVVFDAANLASGVYIYRLETKDAFDSKPMILLK